MKEYKSHCIKELKQFNEKTANIIFPMFGCFFMPFCYQFVTRQIFYRVTS